MVLEMKKQCSSLFYYIFILLYLEIFSKLLIFKNFNNFLYTLVFTIPIILIIYLLSNISKEKINKIITYILSFILSFYYSFQVIFYRLFSNIFSFNTIGLASDITEFKNVIFSTIIANIFIILLLFIPFIILIIFNKKISFKRLKMPKIIITIFLFFTFYFFGLISLNINKKAIYSAYNLYYNVNSEIKITEKFGIATYTRLDIKRLLFGFEVELKDENKHKENKAEKDSKEKIITYNKLDIDFDTLINSENNKTIKDMLTYFSSKEATNKNDYTGMFKGKNLIFILAEGFNEIAIDKDLTPTLYKLSTEGFNFTNFYSPVFLSTTGGEFQATTGLIPTQEILSNWKKLVPNIKYALGNSFKEIGYNASSYHNWTYTYYGRQKTMPTLGFDNFIGCGNGMEDLIDCSWLPSDIDMFKETFPLYEDKTPFVTYYVSVSGHAPYVYNSTGNSIALKNKDLVKDLPYSNNVKAYLATQIELDRAIEALIDLLDKKGILDDTVISFVGDHYPYTLTIDEINEISETKRDEIVEVNHSKFIIWNNKMKKVTIDKVGSQIDVLPTLLNLFGINYDSRLIIGQDILSDNAGLAIFSNRSWVSDYGTYKNGHFTLKEGKELPYEEYINDINTSVNNRFNLSSNIIKYNIYDYFK